jgi:GAF domain-containing protein
MEPLPEVRAAAEQLASLTGIDVLESIEAVAEVATAVVPSCVAVSLTIVIDGHPFTVTSTSEDGAVLDAAQYLDGGPCVETTETGSQVSVPDVLDERRWQTYDRAAAELGIRSSLSLPIWGADGQTPGAINLYASEPDAFLDNAGVLAVAFRVPVEQLVANADLSFMTKRFAEELPDRLDAKERIDTVVGVLMGLHGWTADGTRSRLRNAAARAGAAEEKVADLLLSIYQDSSST